jgi:hypothetical protein
MPVYPEQSMISSATGQMKRAIPHREKGRSPFNTRGYTRKCKISWENTQEYDL